MVALTSSLSLSKQFIGKDHHHHSTVVEEIEGLIRVHRDGFVERPQIVPSVTASCPSELKVNSKDVLIDIFTNTWARFYVPIISHQQKLPFLVYFHGGGFCVGSAAWGCYHEFLSKLSSKLGCLIMSVNYRLAPENPLPCAYEDGFKALLWVKQQVLDQYKASEWWTTKCNFSSVFIAGDSAGANIAYNVATRLAAAHETDPLRPVSIKGLIIIQPFFGGEERTVSEIKSIVQPSSSPDSALNLAASDTYWRLALPSGSNRDHPWCNPLAKGCPRMEELKLGPVLVFISEMDILKDRNLEFCAAMERSGKKVEYVIYEGVGHAFQVLSKSQLSQSRTLDMMAHIKAFMDL